MSPTLPIHRATMDAPIGTLHVAATPRAIVAIGFDLDTDASVFAAPPDAQRWLDAARRQLDEYFAGDRTQFRLPLEPRGSSFQRAVWTRLCALALGTTVSYARLARSLGRPTAARAVGAANAKNPVAIVVPCHRVIGSDGSLTGYAGGLPRKAWLLEHEREVLARGAAMASN